MKITDEMLSAFLDSELPEPQMQHIRELLLQDEQLAERLAALAEVDLLLRQQASLIDGTPVPQQLMALLDEPEQGSVIRFPFWRRLAQPRRWHSAAAACMAFAAGYAMVLWQQQDPWSEISVALETQPAGASYQLGTDSTLTPHLTFLDQQGRYCRHYQISSTTELSQQLACRSAEGWQLEAMVKADVKDGQMYQTASGTAVLDPVIDQMISGQVLSLSGEQQLIQQGWSTKHKGE
ncbi:MAG TPA: hypothetical protein VJ795_17670 [Rheinheimera sp.]|uniref:hypothetical protein n=1 Tax=Rheinheimera sp. TaxID=1869214 RepID=UPI002B4A304E|nr:hypothetical protein [Rheinheimera sp.]HJS16906.1 hypothetical protein [Rheinheimera sp.]